MAIRVRCPNPACGRTIRAAEDMIGRHARCPACGEGMLVEANGMDTIECPGCGGKLARLPGQDGALRKCPHCRTDFIQGESAEEWAERLAPKAQSSLAKLDAAVAAERERQRELLLGRCIACRERVSTKAHLCPHCGHSLSQTASCLVPAVCILLLIFMVCGLVGGCAAWITISQHGI